MTLYEWLYTTYVASVALPVNKWISQRDCERSVEADHVTTPVSPAVQVVSPQGSKI